MPGLHTLVSLQDNGPEEASRRRDTFKVTLQKMRHYPSYATKLLIDSNSLMLAFSGYPGYPLKLFDKGDRTIAVEGKVFNIDDQYLTNMLSTLSLEPQDLESELAKFLPNADGEFIIQMYDREQAIYLLFNDALGRLPIYYHSSPHSVVISREVKFIHPFLDKVTFSRDALAEFLVFRWPLREKTLLENVYRLSPATLLLMDIKKQSFISKPVLLWNLESEPITHDELNAIVDNLVTLFADALKRRTSSFAGYTPVISLSGGFDSRTILATLTKQQTNPIAMTYTNREDACEVPRAKETTHRLKVKHTIVPLSSAVEVDLEELKQLAYLKDGLNYVAMSYLLKFYPVILNDLGSRIIGYTGDGGDKTLAPLGFNPHINSSKQLGQFIYCESSYFNFTWKEASLLLGVDEKGMSQDFEAYLASYPEQSFEGKYKHFEFFERVLKWHIEGECRNRFFYWHTSPFYSSPFFREVMRIPQVDKKDRRLYRTFLSRMELGWCGELGRVGGLSRLSNLQLKLSKSLPIWVIALMFPVLKKMQPLIMKGQDIESLRNISLETLERCKTAKDYFNVVKARKVITNEKSGQRLFTLLTLLLYMELTEDKAPNY